MRYYKLTACILNCLLFFTYTVESKPLDVNLFPQPDSVFKHNTLFLEFSLNNILGSSELKNNPLKIRLRTDYNRRFSLSQKNEIYFCPILTYEYNSNIRNAVFHKWQSNTVLYGIGIEHTLFNRDSKLVTAGFQSKHRNEFVKINSNSDNVDYQNKGLEYSFYINPEISINKIALGSLFCVRYTRNYAYRDNAEHLNFQTTVGATFKF